MEISEIKPGDVLFVWGSGPIDEAIEFITHGPSHCAIFLDQTTLAEAQAGRTTGTSPITDYLKEHDKRLEVWGDETLTEQERKIIVADAKSDFGVNYDYIAILVELARFEINVPINSFHEGKRRICSTYVNNRSKSVGRNWANVPFSPAPVDLISGGKLTRKGVIDPWRTNTQRQSV